MCQIDFLFRCKDINFHCDLFGFCLYFISVTNFDSTIANYMIIWFLTNSIDYFVCYGIKWVFCISVRYQKLNLHVSSLFNTWLFFFDKCSLLLALFNLKFNCCVIHRSSFVLIMTLKDTICFHDWFNWRVMDAYCFPLCITGCACVLCYR